VARTEPLVPGRRADGGSEAESVEARDRCSSRLAASRRADWPTVGVDGRNGEFTKWGPRVAWTLERKPWGATRGAGRAEVKQAGKKRRVSKHDAKKSKELHPSPHTLLPSNDTASFLMRSMCSCLVLSLLLSFSWISLPLVANSSLRDDAGIIVPRHGSWRLRARGETPFHHHHRLEKSAYYSPFPISSLPMDECSHDTAAKSVVSVRCGRCVAHGNQTRFD